MPGARCSAISTTFATQPYSLPYPDPVLVAGLCFALAELVAWGRCPLARHKGGRAVSPAFRADMCSRTFVMTSIRLCRPGDPPPPVRPCALHPPVSATARVAAQRCAPTQTHKDKIMTTNAQITTVPEHGETVFIPLN